MPRKHHEAEQGSAHPVPAPSAPRADPILNVYDTSGHGVQHCYSTARWLCEQSDVMMVMLPDDRSRA